MVAEVVNEAEELDVITRALEIIDAGLTSVQRREIISSDEVADLLLDLRTLLVPFTTEALDDAEVAVVSN